MILHVISRSKIVASKLFIMKHLRLIEKLMKDRSAHRSWKSMVVSKLATMVIILASKSASSS